MGKRFEKYHDRDLGCTITSEKHRERVMHERGLGDVRDWEKIENMKKVRDENKKAFRAKENAYLDEPIKRALEQAANGEDFIPELEAKLQEESDKKERELEERATRNREREIEERERWARDHQVRK